MSVADRAPPTADWLVADAARTAWRSRERRAVAVADLFLPIAGRLRDDDRVTIARLLDGLVDMVERDLRLRLAASFADAPMLSESLASRIAIARPVLERAGTLRDATLVTVLARRSEDARTVTALRHARKRSAELDDGTEVDPIARLTHDPDPAIAAASVRLIEGDHARRDPLGRPLLGPAELPAEAQHRLVWQIAAALRDYIVASRAVPPQTIDPAIARSAEAALAGYDEGEAPFALALGLARALWKADRLHDSLVAGALAAGHAGFTVAGLAVRAGIGFAAAWDMALDPDGARLLLLCRAAAMAPREAADIALRLAQSDDDDALADRLDGYAAIAPDRAIAALALWRLDPVYLDAVTELAGSAR